MTISRYGFWVVLAISLVVTAGIRSIGIESMDLNYDENATVAKLANIKNSELLIDYLTLNNLTTEGDLSVKQIANDIYHTYPSYFLGANLWLAVSDGNVWDNLRIFSLLWGILTVPIIGIIGLKFGRSTAIIAMGIALLHPMLQFHSAYVRFYSIYIFFSALGFAAALWMPYLIQKKQHLKDAKNLLLIFLLALATIFPITLHLGGYIISFAIFVLAFMRFGFTPIGYVYGAFVFLLSIIPNIKTIFFFYIRWIDPNQANNVMSSSVMHALFSIGFNFGVGIVIAAAIVSLISFFIKSKNSFIPEKYNRDINSLSIALVCAVVPMLLLIFVQHSFFRPDYASGLLPPVIVLSGLFLKSLIGEIRNRLNSILVAISIFILIIYPSSIPFFSNIFVDGDRIDYKKVAIEVSKINNNKPAYLVSDVPGNFDILPETKDLNLTFIHYNDLPDIKYTTLPKYAVVREIKGFQSNWFPRLTSVDGKVIAILNKNRFDHRMVRIYIVAME